MPPARLFCVAKYDLDLEILFRRLWSPLPFGWKPGLHWQVEAYYSGMEQPPIGICWVMDFASLLPRHRRHEAFPPVVEYVRVFPDSLRCGVATALLDAARTRWPNLELSGAASEEGAALIRSYLARVEQQGEAGRAFVARHRETAAQIPGIFDAPVPVTPPMPAAGPAAGPSSPSPT